MSRNLSICKELLNSQGHDQVNFPLVSVQVIVFVFVVVNCVVVVKFVVVVNCVAVVNCVVVNCVVVNFVVVNCVVVVVGEWLLFMRSVCCLEENNKENKQQRG